MLCLNHVEILRNTVFYVSYVLQQLGDIFIKPNTHCKRFYKAPHDASEVEIHLHGHKKPCLYVDVLSQIWRIVVVRHVKKSWKTKTTRTWAETMSLTFKPCQHQESKTAEVKNNLKVLLKKKGFINNRLKTEKFKK